MRKCKHCGGPMTGKKANAAFCSDSCRARNWEKRHGIQQPTKAQPRLNGTPERDLAPAEDFHAGLRGILQAEQHEHKTVPPKANTDTGRNARWPQHPGQAAQELEKAKAYLRHADAMYRQCTIGLRLLETSDSSQHPASPQLSPRSRSPLFRRPRTIDSELAWELQSLDNDEWGTEFPADREQDELAPYIRKLQSALARLQDLRSRLTDLVKRMERTYKEQPAMWQPATDRPASSERSKEPDLVPDTTDTTTGTATVQKEEQIQDGYIISTRELMNRHYKALPFKGKWADFFGLPAITFHCLVHGKPGEGKSTFCIQFANYLATDFGKTVYISGEEGFGKTMQDKVRLSNATSPDLYICDLRSFEGIMNKIPARVYHFIFIDSLDNLGIDAQKMKEIRKRFKDSALITISQSTKDGRMRGSQELNHDADITVSVRDGVATTEKNRFLEKYHDLRVFDQRSRKRPGSGGGSGGSDSTGFFELKNTI